MRAKLKTLETKNKDLEFQNSILLERVSVFEKAEKEAIYEKYFPKPETLPTAQTRHSLPSQPTPHGHQSHCCCQRIQCCQPVVGCPPFHSGTVPSSTDSTEMILKSIAEMKSELSTLKFELNRISSSRTPRPASVQTAHGLSNNVDESAADDSTVTVDEEISELCDEEGLNSHVPTI